MISGQPCLAIDYGAVSTTAVLAWPDGRWLPLLFDGATTLPSGVYVVAGSEPVTGLQAWRQAGADTARFIAAPVRAGTGTVTVGDVDVEVRDLVAATLRRVAVVAAEVAGAPVGDVRMVVPAGWGPRRRTWLRHAAHRAGLGEPRLVETPVAAADHLLAAGVQVPVGVFLLVVDVGGGCEATVLRRGPAGFEVLSTVADPDAGGDTVDRLLAEYLSAVHAAPVSAADGSQHAPVDAAVSAPHGGDGAAVGGSWWSVVAGVRAGKEELSRHPAVTVGLPAPAPPVVVTGATVDELARPVLKRVGELAAGAVDAAEVTVGQLGGVYCIGGAAAMPAVPQRVGEDLGVTVTVPPDPGSVAVLGAAGAGGRADAAGRRHPAVPAPVVVPPVRRAVGLAVPGLASLVLFAHFLSTAGYSAGGRGGVTVHYYVNANWGELAMAAVFAVVMCLAAGSLLGALLVQVDQSRAGAPTAGRSSQAPVGRGVLAAAAMGVAVAGMYAVSAALYFKTGLGSPLRWALYPAVGVAVIAVVIAGIAFRRWRVPVQGWDAFLAFPAGAVVAGAAGMVLVQYAMTERRPSSPAVLVPEAGRVGGLLLGVAVAYAVAGVWLLRLLIAVPVAVFMAVIVSSRSTGILAVIVVVAVLWWWVRRLVDLVRSPIRGRDHAY